MEDKINGILSFIQKAEKLKTELRHSWTSDVTRQESVAEHSWSSCLLAILLFDEISTKVDLLKTLKMIIVHDLPEALVGDIPAFEVSKRQDNKFENEKQAMQEIAADLSDKRLAEEIVSLWEEFEEEKTLEAVFARACDKFDVLLQHLNTKMDTWVDVEYTLNPYYCEGRFNFDNFIRKFKDKVNHDTMKAIENAGMLEKVNQEHREMWERQKNNT
jgi:putative hydrolase of HD superfamily